jgi:tRNA pseudouridine38-40 synthase
MRNLKLTLAYDGTDFHGWQIQPGVPTVQGTLGEALHKITQESPVVCGAGSTDAGVHAWGQVANFKTGSELSPETFGRALNALLPLSIRVRHVEEVSPDFHARWLAHAKTYRYRIYRGAILSPFVRHYVLHDPQRLDFAAMADAARQFEGEHDFTSFAASTGDEEEDEARTMVRIIDRSELLAGNTAAREAPPENFSSQSAPCAPCPEEWVYIIRGRSFLRYMVRKIVGTLLDVGRGRLAASEIPRLFELRDPARSGPTALPQGLCLESIEYPDAGQSSPDQV